MNKRIALILAAVSVFGWGCAEKKKVSSVTDDITGDYAEESEISAKAEYSDSDFKVLNVTLSYPEGEAPVKVESTDLSGIEVGERVPVCNRAEFAEQCYGQEYWNDQTVYNWQDFVDKPIEGVIESCYTENDLCFLYISYPNFKFDIYDWEVLCYDPKSGSTEEVYSWSAERLEDRCNPPCFGSGALFSEVYDSSGEKGSVIYKTDLYTHETEQVFEGSTEEYLWLHTDDTGAVCILAYPKDSDDDGVLYKFNSGKDGFVLSEDTGAVRIFAYPKDSDDDGVLYKFDSDKDEFVLSEDIEAPENSVSNDRFNGVQSHLVKREGSRKLDMDNEFYHAETSVSTGIIVYADAERFIIRSGNKLHTYDITKMEHYISDITDMGDEIKYSCGMVFIGNRSNTFRMPVYCIMPELGLTYPVCEKGIYGDIRRQEDGISFNSIHNVENTMVGAGGEVFLTYSLHAVDKVYRLTVES